jgi:hypothetical protein
MCRNYGVLHLFLGIRLDIFDSLDNQSIGNH